MAFYGAPRDAHLKNFGITYDDVPGEARPAPVFGLIAIALHLPKDRMALTLNGTTEWPDEKALRRLGETRLSVSPAKIRQILPRISDALSDSAADVRSYIQQHPEFAEVGERMLPEWEKGRELSLKPVG